MQHSTRFSWACLKTGFLMLMLTLPSCISHWTVVHAADPNLLLGHRWFKLQAIDYAELTVDSAPEETFTAEMDASKFEEWQAEKTAIQTNFARAFQVSAAEFSIELGDTGDYTIQPSVTAMETGHYQVPGYLAVARIHLTLKILDSSGQTVDEIHLQPEFKWDFFNASSSGRLRSLATRLGSWAGEYLIQRAGHD